MLQKQLTVFLLYAAMFLVPLNSFAHDLKSEATNGSCACQLADHNPEERNGQPDNCPTSNSDNFCDCEGCYPEATESSLFCGLQLNVFVAQLFHQPANSFFLKVYLTIFVPPESSSLT